MAKKTAGIGALALAGWPGWLAACVSVGGMLFFAVVIPQPSIGVPNLGDGLIKPKEIEMISSVAKLRQLFTRIEYSLEAVRAGERTVPPLFLAAVPAGMQQIEEIEERKRVFLRMILPLVLKANDHVAKSRERLLAIHRARGEGKVPTGEDRRYMARLAVEYGLGKPDLGRLLLQVDAVPVSLALAQSAIESGWGTSRFVELGNATFGQWTTADYEGIVPDARPDGATYKVRSFQHLFDSVRSYIHNLNTHAAYSAFRQARAAMRSGGRKLDSLELASTLVAYSQEGEAYLALLRQVIVTERLVPFDRARLGERVPLQGPDA